MHAIDLTGYKFGKWIVNRRGPNAKGRQARWWCLCECGVETLVLGYYLRQNRGYGCKQCAGWKGCGELSGYYWQQLINGACQRNIKFDLKIEYAWELFLKQGKRCALSLWGLTFMLTYKRRKEQTASLDRIDSSKGYEVGNVQWVHKDVNLMKNKLSQDRFIRLCKAIGKYHMYKDGDPDVV